MNKYTTCFPLDGPLVLSKRQRVLNPGLPLCMKDVLTTELPSRFGMRGDQLPKAHFVGSHYPDTCDTYGTYGYSDTTATPILRLPRYRGFHQWPSHPFRKPGAHKS